MKKILYSVFVGLICLSYFALPYQASAQTIQEFEAEVKKYTKELQEKQSKLAKNNEEVQAIKKRIREIENQIEAAKDEIEKLQQEIDESNLEIKEKDKESKKIVEYYQVSNGDNAYLEYAFGANDITDMVYRMSVVEQLIEYNDNIMKELEALIKKNQEMQKELTEKNEEMEKLRKELQAEKARIDADSSEIIESLPSIQERIKEAQSNLNYFKKLGCGTTEDILACQYRIEQRNNGGSLPSVGAFVRPIEYGYVVRGFTGRSSWDHLGVDMSSSNKTIEVHPIATGQIFTIYEDNCTTSNWCGYWCNGNAKIVVIRHNYNNQYIYASYMHLSRYGNIREGQIVTKDSIIGYMGTSGCSTGNHLHLELSYCFWKNGGGCTYDSYRSRLINPTTMVAFPGSWNNR